MTKSELFERLRTCDGRGGPSAVARILGIKPQAVSQWPDPIPQSREFELRGRRPDLFPAVKAQPSAPDEAVAA